MHYRLWIGLGLVTFGLCGFRLLADNDKPNVSLPVTRVVLTNAGYAYFHREGRIDGDARFTLPASGDINDLLLTLKASDPQGPVQIRFDTPKIFKIDVTANPTLADLLGQVRGEAIEVTASEPAAIKGRLVSVIPPKHDDSNKLVEDGSVNIVADDGLTSVPLSKLKKVKFSKPELQADFVAALEALAAKNADVQSLALTFRGNGPRAVSIGYIADAPLWKPNYRLNVAAEGAKLQGFAAVENTTEEDWKNVSLKLVSGRPVTFRMEMTEPLFVPRPFVEPALYASLRPPLYQGSSMGGLGGALGGGFLAQGQGVLGANGIAQNLGNGGGIAGVGGGQLGQFGNSYYNRRYNRMSFEQQRTEMKSDITAVLDPVQAATASLGEAFEYTITEPVTMARAHSALLPMMNETVEVKRLSIYNPQILGTYPLKGFQLKNTSKLFIAQGPIAVYDGDTVAGQARLPDVKPGENHLLSYAIDLDTPISQEQLPPLETAVGMTIAKGSLNVKTLVRTTLRTTVLNRGTEAKTVWVTTLAAGNAKLVSPPQPAERTANLNRFEIKVPSGGRDTLDVVEEYTRETVVSLADAGEPYLQSTTTLPAVKAALVKVKQAATETERTRKAIEEETQGIATVIAEQTRLRANLAAVPKESEVHQRYVKMLDSQETEIAARRVKVKEWEAKREQQAKDYTALLQELKVE